MKTFIVLVALISVAVAGVPNRRPIYNQLAAPLRSGENVVIVNETPSNNIGLGGYRFGYVLSDGQSRSETAEVETRGPEDAILRVSGSYNWVDPVDGQTYSITYVADENGFQPQGAHLPVAPK